MKLHNLTACLVSKHQKLDYVASTLSQAFSWLLVGNESFDTDMLGTFSGESERTLTAIECAIYKAEKALKLSDADIGLGSEGSFNPDPYGVMTVNQELVACVHRDYGLLAVGQATRPVHVHTWMLKPSDSGLLDDIANHLPPSQGIIMRIVNPDSTLVNISGNGDTAMQYGDVYKGLLTLEQMYQAFSALCSNSASSQIEVCYDLRAMHCPERQTTIRLAASNLVERLQSVCPKCDALDFYASARIPGLPCETCGLPTRITKAIRAHCKQCEFELITPVEQATTDTVNCNFCNP